MSKQRKEGSGVWLDNMHLRKIDAPNAVLGFWKAKVQKENAAAITDYVGMAL